VNVSNTDHLAQNNPYYGKIQELRLAYIERVRNGEDLTLAEKWLLKGLDIQAGMDKRMGYLSEEQAYAATYEADGFQSDISTIPLKDAETDPHQYFIDNYDWSNIPFESIPIREYIEKYQEAPKLAVGNNIQAWAVKHEDIRKGWLQLYATRNWWNLDNARTTTDMRYISEMFTRCDLYDKGFWLYPVMMIQVADTPLKGLTLKEIAYEDKKEKNKRHPLNIGSNYQFTLYNTKTKMYAGLYRHDKDPRWVWNEKDSKYIPLSLSRENLLRSARKIIPANQRKHYVMRRYRVLLGKPIYMKDKWAISQDRRRLTFKYNKGEIQPEYSRFLEHMVERGEMWQRTDTQWDKYGKQDEESSE